MEKIKQKVVLIAGGTGSIGRVAARLLHSSGATVYITGRDADKLKAVAAEAGIPAPQTFVLDITNAEDVLRLPQQMPTPDILINATGIGIIKPFEQLTIEEFQQSIAVNLYGPMYLLKVFLPGMKERKTGLIINIPGVLGKTPMAGATAYSASKYGLNGMMKSLREELKRTDIRITQLFLGGVDSHFWDTIDLRVQRDKMIMAEEAGKAIWFLCQQPLSGVVSEMVVQPFNHQVI